jgi:hypothetical protein
VGPLVTWKKTIKNLGNKAQFELKDMLKHFGVVVHYIALVLCKILKIKSHDEQL